MLVVVKIKTLKVHLHYSQKAAATFIFIIQVDVSFVDIKQCFYKQLMFLDSYILLVKCSMLFADDLNYVKIFPSSNYFNYLH